MPSEALPLIRSGAASPDPELDALKERARKLGQAVDWQMPERKRPRASVLVTASASTDDESFADKIKRAIAARLPRAQTCQQHAEQVKRENARYPGRGIKRRARTKGE